ncbi:alpha/beta hydrolase-fold protein [Tistrella sp. BH-R2-4]|uniref:Alpha/beta hydrolase-fold protein n=1 Tax=Tistrella arctica TaxID=3133430 RepID=A0ABU9YHP8_9PROT
MTTRTLSPGRYRRPRHAVAIAWVLALVAAVTIGAGQAAVQAAHADGLPGARPAVVPDDRGPVTVPGSHWFDITAQRNGLVYRIQVATPDGIPPEAGFPVLYLLDGNAMFGLAAQTARLLAAREGSLAVVAIGYPGDAPFDMTRRYLDLTSPVTPAMLALMGPRAPVVPTGGQDAFLDVILNEIRPAIARRFPIDPDRATLFGHSLGGRFVLHAALTRPQAFKGYVASSPSIWWNDGDVAEDAAAYAARDRRPPLNLLLMVGGEEQAVSIGAESPERAAFRRMARMLDNLTEMADRLRALQVPGARIDQVVFAGEGHMTTVPAAISRAVVFASEP